MYTGTDDQIRCSGYLTTLQTETFLIYEPYTQADFDAVEVGLVRRHRIFSK